MLEADSLTRSILYPRAFPAGVLAVEAFIRLDLVPDSKEVYEVSVGPRGRFADEGAAHEFGCRVAAKANARTAETAAQSGKVHEPACYIGYYSIKYGDLLRVTADFHHIAVVWSPDQGLEEHCDLVVRWNGYPSSRRSRKDERLAIQVDLAALLSGPIRGLCPCDEARHNDLSAIELPTKRPVAA